ncbi:SixA phosphatase family protein [Halomonas beimenensis]|uniref:Phosphohistidine phosphatase SixA n=1 Tax=Halomonas beimenensis TaxID=475662 RepID=A0A291PBT4_9GAMM|nr:histidine phosphatase family protein [Halomonas beimenensis]ATJ84350.1 phosphohistidine phosphatase SixA [Halomonas beimenensis]
MPRELLLLRHGKSDWSTPVDDVDRPLKKRGRRGARRIGVWLAKQGKVPERILTSPALRAKATAELCAEAMGLAPAVVEVEEDLYAAGPEALARVVARCPDVTSRLMVVGHNPGLEDFLTWLLPEPPPVPEDGKLLPTAALARVELDGAWASLGQGAGRLVELVTPRQLS